MEEILGNKVCMESLVTDIQDVQWVINDVSSRIGPLDVSSWKFPDKQSWEVDVENLLELYSFAEDEKEDNQIAHVALYELLIDRLVLLVQGTAVYLTQTQLMGKSGNAAGQTSTSVGLTAKYFWTQLNGLQSVMQQLLSQNKANTRKVTEMEKNLQKFSSQISLNSPSVENGHGSESSFNNSGRNALHSPPRGISIDESNKGSQTIETAFVPCESCDVVQKKMRESGDLVIDACQKESLPSSLRKYRPTVSHVRWLSYNDVSRWMSEQNKDIQRLCKHIETMSATIDPLKAQVDAFQKETNKAESKAKQCETEMQREKETQLAVKRQYEVKLQEKEKQHVLTLADLHRQKEELQRKQVLLVTELDQRKTQTTDLQSKLQHWETKSQELERDLQEKSAVAGRVEEVEQEVVSLRQQLTDTQSHLEVTTRTLAKEQGKNKNAAQHKQQVQAKTEQLSERMRELNEENEELRDRVAGLEDEKQGLEDTLQETKQRTDQLHKEKKEQEIIISHLKQEMSCVAKSLAETESEILRMEHQLVEAKERERLIIEYPDLNGPVNPDLQGTGDIVLDMENQVKANSMRIGVLEQQNDGLTRSISKIRGKGHESSGATHKPAPIPLWQTSGADVGNYKDPPNYHQPPPSPESQSRPYHQPPPSAESHSRPYQAQTVSDTSLKSYTPSHDRSSKPPSSHSHRAAAKGPTSNPDFFTVGKSPSGKDHHQQQQRRPASGKGGAGPPRGKSFVPVNSTAIGAYKQIMKSNQGYGDPRAGHATALGKNNRPPSGHTTEAPSQHRPAPGGGGGGGGGEAKEDFGLRTFICEYCDKIYYKERDLEIHRSYCTA